MRLPRAFGDVSWRAALGEFALIVVGVSVALAAGAWYEARQERGEEAAVLAQFASALEGDIEELLAAKERTEGIREDLLALKVHLERDASDPYDGSFGGVIGFVTMGINTAPYEALKSRGLELIADDSLRLALVQYYETTFPSLAAASGYTEELSSDVALPYFLSHFRRLPDSSWTPLDHAAVHNDPYLANLVLTKLNRVEGRILPRYESCLTLARELVTWIEGGGH